MSEPGSLEQPDEALVDLLIKQVTEGLSPAEQRALDALDSAPTSRHLRDFERAAAAISLAGVEPLQPLPQALRERLERDAHLPAGGAVADLGARRDAAAARPRRASPGGAAGWWAAAACLVLALFGWLRAPQAPPPVAVVEASPPAVATPPAPVAPPTPAEARAALLAKAESIKVALGATKDPAAAGLMGDVVWDAATQTGFLHIAGLAANDPQKQQYQMWIFDGKRDKRYPVDGGVFDVPANATEVVIPIRSELPVRAAAAFAITLEKPGGAVVSAREHLLALGAAG